MPRRKSVEQNDPAVVKWLEQEQAAHLVKKAVTAFGEGVEKVFISTDVDWPNYYMPIWRHMGLLDAQGRRKPAFTAFKTMVEQLDGFVSARRIGGEGRAEREGREEGEERTGVQRSRLRRQADGGRLQAFEFARDGQKIVVLWNEGEEAVDLTRYLGSRNVELVDLQGQRRTVRVDSLRIGNSPVFLHVE
jgi:hypothetical protein